MGPSSNRATVPTVKFLQEVKKRPCLWDPNHSLYGNSSAKKSEFCSIALVLMPSLVGPKVDEAGYCLDQKWDAIHEHYFKITRDPVLKEKYTNNQFVKLLAFLERGGGGCPSSRSSLEQPSCNKSNRPSRDCSPTLGVGEDLTSDETPANKRKHCYQSTVNIDGVEFEQVTLDSGEVIVKLKEEVLDDCPPFKKLDSTNKIQISPAKNIQGSDARKSAGLNKLDKPRNSTERDGTQPDHKVIGALETNSPKKSNIVRNKKSIEIKNQNAQVRRDSVEPMAKEFVSHCDQAHRKMEVMDNQLNLIEISDDEGQNDAGLNTNCDKRKVKNVNCLDRWSPTLKGLAALPVLSTNLDDDTNESGKDTLQSNILADISNPSERTETNCNAAVFPKLNTSVVQQTSSRVSQVNVLIEASTQDQNSSSVPLKRLKTNRNPANLPLINSMKPNQRHPSHHTQTFGTSSQELTLSQSDIVETISISSSNDPNDHVDAAVIPRTNDAAQELLDIENMTFLSSLLPQMRQMSDHQNYQFRLDVVEALTRCMYP